MNVQSVHVLTRTPDGWTALHHAVDAECDAESNGVEPATGRLVALLVAAALTQTRLGKTQPPGVCPHRRSPLVTATKPSLEC